MDIYDDKIRLHAVLEMPTGNPEKCPLVIVIHGFTGHSEERHILAAAHTMNEQGYATLRVDMYGHGKSEGEFKNHTLFKWISNALTVIDYAKALPFVTDLYLCGHSQGGLAVMLAAGLKHEDIRAIIPLAPAVMIPEAARDGELFGQKFDPNQITEEYISPEGWVLSGNYIRTAQLIHVEDAIARFTGPVLIIHSDTDEAVPWQCSAEAAKLYQNAEYVNIPNDTHCYDNHLDQVLDTIRKWLPKI